MHPRASNRYSRRQRICALACLLGLILIYAPIASATLMILTGACCSGDQCPIHGDHHATHQQSSTPMDCAHQHDQAAGMTACSMSCCHNDPRAAVHANAFILAASATSLGFSAADFTPQLAPLLKLFCKFAPLSPPPEGHVSQTA